VPKAEISCGKTMRRELGSLRLTREDTLRQQVGTAMTSHSEEATFGGGCFWCLEAVFQELHGVQSVKSGYAGGSAPDPKYKDVCSGVTGHAEVVKIKYDPAAIDYADLVRIFFAIHDPTTKDRQGNDKGTQYRSIILYASEAQRETATAVLKEVEAEGVYPDPIVTEVQPLEKFWPAEDYHDDYFRKNPNQPYCAVVVGPKVAKFRKRFKDRLKTA
jgi:peptide-methionine (S)-S-oxide reductase